MQLNRAILALSALLASTSALPHLGRRDVEKGIVVNSVPTTTDPLCLQPIRPLPSGITAPTGMPCPSGNVCLPPLGPWPFKGPYHHKPPSRYPNGFKPIALADGPFPAVGGHSWNVPYQQFKICGTASLPTATGTSGIAPPVGTGVGVMPTSTGTESGNAPLSTGTATGNAPMSSCVSGAACPSGTMDAIAPAPIGGAVPLDV